MLSHPAWTGIGAIVALLALLVSIQQALTPSSPPDVSTEETSRPATQQSQELNYHAKLQEKRVALVVGNSNYQNLPGLANTERSAREFAQFLESVHFQVRLLVNGTKKEMEKAFGRFIRDMGVESSASVFYFSGYALNIEGRNYLLPIDVETKTERDTVFTSISFDWALEQQGETQKIVGFVILDILPPERYHSSPKQQELTLALSHVERIPNILAASLVTTRGVATDDPRGYSLYTRYLIEALSRPGLPAYDAFHLAGHSLREATNGQLSAYMASSVSSEPASKFVFTEQGVAQPKPNE